MPDEHRTIDGWKSAKVDVWKGEEAHPTGDVWFYNVHLDDGQGLNVLDDSHTCGHAPTAAEAKRRGRECAARVRELMQGTR